LLTHLDNQKAFETISHKKLLQKVMLAGASDELLGWIASFSADQKMDVRVGKNNSGWVEVLIGVLQDSVFGPLLFLVYVNKLLNWVVDNTLMLADDINLWAKMNLLEHSISLQDDQYELLA
jgi:Reverse transcriptase (RNA-dependent DNA polymerase)